MSDVSLDQSQQLLDNIKTLINSHLTKIDELKSHKKEASAMLDETLKNDPVYNKHDEDAKNAAKVRTQTKLTILKQPKLTSLAEKVKSITSELKELNNALSDYLREYQRLS